MTNSWSLLAHYLEGTMDETFPIKTQELTSDQIYDAVWGDDGFHSPTYTISEGSSEYKYNEDKILDSIKEYIGKTYSKNYSNKIQTLDLIDSVGDASAFCRSNILKYASRYDKKGTPKLDIQKIIHYAVLLYHFEGLDNDGYETI